MSFEQTVKLPRERIGVLIGRGGEQKRKLEEMLRVELSVDSESGDVRVRAAGVDFEEVDPFKAIDVVDAIGKGFSPERAVRLLGDGQGLTVVDLREYAGKSKSSMERLRGRVIGEGGKARRLIEELTGASVSVYGHYVAIIGDEGQGKLAREAVEALASGAEHKVVYEMLQRARTKAKLERLKLWEDQPADERSSHIDS
jgi:ribosomal RNA assembly protein